MPVINNLCHQNMNCIPLVIPRRGGIPRRTIEDIFYLNKKHKTEIDQKPIHANWHIVLLDYTPN